ncbi:DUF2927 domain-containing protein [Jannaschia donghaensis]|uniref:ATP-dependent transcriptional regulator n=1 Tax=Jannaschia donghaensis TaxID=420998 RepID=A0A0M6YGG4_9RHOB|nr:DUF2927 domain-containing protein [Jannaschia donghaensis]CTQ48869.1 hypothetical protein JDO7802_00877 [Jannaschia donghaensis]
MLRPFATLAVMTLAACAPSGLTQKGGTLSPQTTRATIATAGHALPAPQRFSGAPVDRLPVQPNGQLARDFMALTFQLETGRQIDTFTRFEGPITVALENASGEPLPPTLQPDLTDLLDRLRSEAKIDIRPAAAGKMGSITISALPRDTLQRVVPGAACFVVPRVAGWTDYLRKRFGPDTDWTTLKTRTRATVFLPTDVSPQEIRDCLHEEVAQALGPLNDLYRLPHSVFNDDNMHVVLTSFDMMILRATYDAGLTSGMTQQQVAARLPAILANVNPRGRLADGGAIDDGNPAWANSIRGALRPTGSAHARLTHAKNAVTLAQSQGWTDERLAFSHLALGRAALSSDSDVAIAAFLQSQAVYERLPGTAIHAAQVALQLGAFALTSGQVEAALGILDGAIPAARDAQNASLLATLLLLRAEAAALQGAPDEAARIRREGLAWGRYAWGDRSLGIRAAQVASLRPGA